MNSVTAQRYMLYMLYIVLVLILLVGFYFTIYYKQIEPLIQPIINCNETTVGGINTFAQTCISEYTNGQHRYKWNPPTIIENQ
jgi:hypothetical protein